MFFISYSRALRSVDALWIVPISKGARLAQHVVPPGAFATMQAACLIVMARVARTRGQGAA